MDQSHRQYWKKSLAVQPTFAESHPCNIFTRAEKAANKIIKYSNFTITHPFVPLAKETAKHNNNLALELIDEIGTRTSAAIKDPFETSYLFERISMAIQLGNAHRSRLLSEQNGSSFQSLQNLI